MDGYRLTTRGKIVLVLLLGLLAYGLFNVGTLLGNTIKTSETHSQSQSMEATTNQTENSAVEQTGVDQTNSSDTTVGKTDNCNVETLKTDTVEEPLPEDLVLIATIVYFAPDSYHIDEQGVQALEPFIKIALDNKTLPIVVEGHSVNSSSEVDDLKLAQKRAVSIESYLIQKGIAKDRIVLMSLTGSSDEVNTKSDVWKIIRAEIYFQGYTKDK